MHIAIEVTDVGKPIRSSVNGMSFYSIEELSKVRGNISINFGEKSIERCDSQVLVNAMELSHFLNGLLSEEGMHGVELYFEPVAYAIRNNNVVDFLLFNPSSFSGSHEENYLGSSSVEQINGTFEWLKSTLRSIFSDVDDDVLDYVVRESAF